MTDNHPVKGLRAVNPDVAPSSSALFGAIGGVRGIIESVAPGFLFLVVFTLTGSLLPSAIAPVVAAVGILLARLIQRLPVMPAVSGGIGIALSAGFALFTGKASDNFVGGFLINGISILVVVLSLLARKPLVGIVAGLAAPHTEWMTDARPRRAVVVTTVLWGCFFALRLVVELPLYFADQTAALAATKLLLGLPAYAAMLWVTWVMLRSARA